MAEKTAYEHGARKLVAKRGRDPNDDFSQKAAENRKPPLGGGLAERLAPKKPPIRPKGKKAPPNNDSEHPTRDTRDTPAPNPNGKARA
jgi:hypothetical protein